MSIFLKNKIIGFCLVRCNTLTHPKITEIVVNTFCFSESERVRQTIPFEVIQYGDVFTKETFDIYGTDLPKGTKLA